MGLDRTASASGYRWRRADDRGHPEQNAPARRYRYRRRHPGRGACQCSPGRTRIFRRTQGDRMTELTDLTIAALRDGFRKGEFSARDSAEAYIAAVEGGRALHAFIVETPEHALAAADTADRGRATGEIRPLSGVQIGRAHV